MLMLLVLYSAIRGRIRVLKIEVCRKKVRQGAECLYDVIFNVQTNRKYRFDSIDKIKLFDWFFHFWIEFLCDLFEDAQHN